jgi:FKBP-type peptidyl-prolyl cis-trans isomerase
MFKLLFIIFFSGLLFSCGSTYSEDDKVYFDGEINKIISKNNFKMDRLENGLYLNVKHVGHGEELIKLTDEVTFSYTGYFSDGNVFQKIADDEALTFPVRSLIVGWQDALSYVSEGGELKMIIPPHLGYGTEETELIPPNSILIYDMKVIKVK